MMHPEEREFLSKFVSKRAPRVVMEIGTAYGGSLQLFCDACPDDAKIISVDLPGGLLFGGGWPACPAWTMFFFDRFAKPGQDMRYVRGDSHKQETIEWVNRVLDGRKIDLLFIDGDHSYTGTRLDYYNFIPFMASGGVIIFHDVNPNCGNNGSAKFWSELRPNLLLKTETQNFHPEIPGLGLGILYL